MPTTQILEYLKANGGSLDMLSDQFLTSANGSNTKPHNMIMNSLYRLAVWWKEFILENLGKLSGTFLLILFVSACASPYADFDKATPLQLALGQGDKSNGYKRGVPDMKKIKMLIESGADVNNVNAFGPALHFASSNTTPEIVDYLISKGANVNLVFGGETPLMKAAQMGRFDIVKLLIERGADLNVTAPSIGWSPLSEAAFAGRLDIVQYLISQGADVAKQSGDAFIRAATGMGINMKEEGWHANVKIGDKRFKRTYEYIAILDLLKSKGANVNSVNTSGETALHMAAMYGSPQVVRYFLKIGVNPKISVNENIGTALDAAQRSKDIYLSVAEKPSYEDRSAKEKKNIKESLTRLDAVIELLTPVTYSINTYDSTQSSSYILDALADQAKNTLTDCIKLKTTLTLCGILPTAAEIGCGLIARAQFSHSVCPF